METSPDTKYPPVLTGGFLKDEDARSEEVDGFVVMYFVVIFRRVELPAGHEAVLDAEVDTAVFQAVDGVSLVGRVGRLLFVEFEFVSGLVTTVSRF